MEAAATAEVVQLSFKSSPAGQSLLEAPGHQDSPWIPNQPAHHSVSTHLAQRQMSGTIGAIGHSKTDTGLSVQNNKVGS